MKNLNGDEEPVAGNLLVSEPFLIDSAFKRTVILLCEHNKEGSVGFILNKKLNVSLKDVMEGDIDMDIPLHLGGPVQKNTLHFIHSSEIKLPNSLDLGNGICWGGSFEIVMEQIENKTIDIDQFRFFLGYSGWGEGQLEDELEANSWILSNASTDLIFNNDEEVLWKRILENMGGNFKRMSNYPESPFLN